MFSANQSISVTSLVPELFVTLFNHHWGEAVNSGGKEVWLDLQLDVLHMMGALFSSSMVCIMTAI